MMKILITVLLVLFILPVYGQTNYYRYNSAGVPEKVGYSEPVNNKPFGEYVPAIDPAAYASVGMELQRRYDANVQSIKNLVSEIQGMLVATYKYDETWTLGTQANLDKYLKSIERYDFGKNNIYNTCYSTLSSFKTSIANTREQIIEDHYRKKYESNLEPLKKEKEYSKNLCIGYITGINADYNAGGIEILIKKDIDNVFKPETKKWFNIEPLRMQKLKVGDRVEFLYYAEGSGGHLYFKHFEVVK